jgi:hypothetical protein
MWYLTRGSGAVTLALLTVSMCLGILGTVGWRTARFPRFTVAALHRNLTLLAVVFLAIHVVTTIADSYTPIGWRDAIVPFLSSYRPIWLGLGAIASDLLIALVVTSMLRRRIGFRLWRLSHWLAYACWPVALVHSLGTGSDPRAAWLQVLAGISVAAALAAVVARLAKGNTERGGRLVLGGTAVAAALLAGLWYRSGPGTAGWAARAGTPTSLLHHATEAGATRTNTVLAVPPSFTARLTGTATQTRSADGSLDVHLDGDLTQGLRGRLRIDLRGVPLADGGVSMTASGVAFAAAGSSVYEGQIVALSGNQVRARVSDGAGHSLDLSVVVELSQNTNAMTGTVRGILV